MADASQQRHAAPEASLDHGGRAAREVYVDGIGIWTPRLSGWPEAALAWRSTPADPGMSDADVDAIAGAATAHTTRPVAPRLSAAERRRVPDTVCLAMAATDQAVQMSGHDPADLAAVFACAHGDLGLTDYLSATVAHDARLISPTRFHNSVHNAPAGYWSMAVACHEASTAIAAYEHTVGAGLLEALCQCETRAAPVVFCAYEMAAPGPLAAMHGSHHPWAFAMVLSPARQTASQWRLAWKADPAPERGGVDNLPYGGTSTPDPSCWHDAMAVCRGLTNARSEPVIIRSGTAMLLVLESRLLQ